MEILKRRTNAARRIALVALACASFATGTCSLDWWFAPFGPGWLGLARESFDVTNALMEKFDATKANVLMVERFSQAGEERVFVLTESDRNRAVFVLDATSMELLAWFGGGLSEIMFQDADGAVIVGQTRIDVGLEATPVNCTVHYIPGTPPDPDKYDLLSGFGFSDGTSYRVIRPDQKGMRLYEATAPESYATPYTPVDFINFATTDVNGSVFDLEELSTLTGNALFVNLKVDSATRAEVYRFENLSALLSAVTSSSTIIGSSTLVMSYPPPQDNRASWLTVDGLVALGKVDGRSSLVRYTYDGIGTELDSFALGDTEDQTFFFDPDGKHWYVFDRWHGRLHLLDTWWSK